MPEQNYILVADDDQQLGTSLGEQLTAEGYNVIVTSNGEEAIHIIKEKRIDLAIIDIKMPKIDGFEVLRFVRKDFPGVKIIMLTAYADIRNISKCKELGAHDVIEKPYDVNDLFDSIHFVTAK